MRDLIVGRIKINTLFAFAVGTALLVLTLMVRLAFPMSNDAEFPVRVTSALAAAAIAAGIPGLFQFAVSSPRKALTIRVTGAFVIFLVVLSMNASRAETVAVIEATLIFLTPLLIRHILRKYRIRIEKPYLVLLSALMVVGAAAFFSQTSSPSLPNPPATSEPLPATSEQGDVFAKYDLKGGKKGTPACVSCQQNMWVLRTRSLRKEADSQGKLHVLLDVEWRKWEDKPELNRNYKGSIYYTVDYECKTDQAGDVDPKLIGYELKPGNTVLSWLIGFVEIPFLLADGVVNREIARRITEKVVEEKLLQCA
jgi:hypothetical protein